MAKINTLNYQTVATWDGANDLFIVEQTDGTKVATPAQVKQYVLGDMDDVPTEDSENPVKSGGIFSTIGDLTQTGLTGDSVAEQLDTAREQIATMTKTSLSEAIILTSGTAYVAPADGYITLESNNSNYSTILIGGTNLLKNKDQDRTSLFIRKGMSVTPSLQSGSSAYFKSFT